MAQVGEFVEVFNQSDTDPAAWLGKIHAVKPEHYVVRASSALRRLQRERSTRAQRPDQLHTSCYASNVRSPHICSTVSHAMLYQILKLALSVQVTYPFHDTGNEKVEVRGAPAVAAYTLRSPMCAPISRADMQERTRTEPFPIM